MLLDYFARDWKGAAFDLFGTPHLIALGCVALWIIGIVVIGRRGDQRTRDFLRYLVATVLVVDELMWHSWNWYAGLWSVQYTLPLHVCSILVWVSAYMLYTQDYRLYEFAYFMGIGAAIQALLTPDAGIYGFPHFRAFQVMISHGTIIAAASFMTWVLGMRPYPRSLLKVIVGMNIYMLIIMVVNAVLGSNYLFIAHKPEVPTLIDAMPPWPWYILILELMGLAIVLLLYIPWFIYDWRNGQKQVAPA